jgi:hypothetical protein
MCTILPFRAMVRNGRFSPFSDVNVGTAERRRAYFLGERKGCMLVEGNAGVGTCAHNGAAFSLNLGNE